VSKLQTTFHKNPFVSSRILIVLCVAAHLYDDWPGHKQSYPTDSLATSGAIVLYKTASKNADILMDIIEGHPSEGKIPPVLQRKLVESAGTFLKGKTLQRFTRVIDSLG